MDARLIEDAPASGSWNMAVDEALFHSVLHSGQAALRFYLWAQPTLSLGYFQLASERLGHEPSRDCPWVRRPTGGGAIVHDRELTYCLVTPLASDRSAVSLAFVRLVHGVLIDVLAQWGLSAEFFGQSAGEESGRQPFLCFRRRTELDVVSGGYKVAGSAQRRLRGTLLQHGSVLLGRSAAAPELPGVAELAGIPLDAEHLRLAWLGPLAEKLQWQLEPSRLSAAELDRAREFEQSKFGNSGWNQRR